MKYSFILALCAAVALLPACRNNNSTPAVAELKQEEAGGAAAVTATQALVLPDNDAEQAPSLPISQKIIKNAVLRFSTSDFEACKKRIADTVKKYGGYIASEKQENTNMQWRNEVAIKVPAAAFEQCVESLTGGASRVDEKSITSTDVTEEYVDLDARMKARLAVEQRYVQILQQAKNVKEILEVEAQLKSIREEIESAKGRLQYMDHHVAYSNISLEYYQTFANSDPQSPGFLQRSWLSFKDGWNGLLSFALGILSAWPLIVGIVFIFIFIKKGIGRWKSRRTPTNVNQ
ncbi:DUF4349 domain-containing protein [Chitinophaga ginsengisegetis]|uniref:DUF4349 domain-containing protein n=1 Tax=Chitinophaga ginsengisegetis TaxID=393003 RepID=UPI00343D6541